MQITLTILVFATLAPYVSPSAADIPATFKDKEGYWSGFAARCRVLIYNTVCFSKKFLWC
jgi:iron(III) transport system substrate-binding protein